MHKTVILGDIHGRDVWKRIIADEKPSRVIFLGDYVSSREGISESDQIKNLEEILEFKEEPEFEMEIILLRGNHDLEALGYHWAECYPSFREKSFFLGNSEALKKRFLKNTQWIYRDEENNVTYSHAGISKTWFSRVQQAYPEVKTVVDINSLEPTELFAFCAGPDAPFDTSGYSKYQPCVWIRPNTLVVDAIEGTQIVGHTPNLKGTCLDLRSVDLTLPQIYLCDCLPKSYLVFENSEFTVKVV